MNGSSASDPLRLGTTIAEMQGIALRRYADRTALVSGDQQVSCAEMDRKIAQYVRLFKQHGLQRGDGFSVLATNRLEVIFANTDPALVFFEMEINNPSTRCFFICRRTSSPVMFTIPTSNPLTPSTATISPFSKKFTVLFRKKSLRLPLLKLISTTRQVLSGSLKGKLANQSCTFMRLHPPVLQLPWLWQPPGAPSFVPHPPLPHPI